MRTRAAGTQCRRSSLTEPYPVGWGGEAMGLAYFLSACSPAAAASLARKKVAQNPCARRTESGATAQTQVGPLGPTRRVGKGGTPSAPPPRAQPARRL